ncbi:MAG: hypothetical protein R6V84_06710 [Desulfobacterales bacterium]
MFIVYILSRIVDKFFLASSALAVKEHPNLALLGPDHNRLAAHAPYHVKRVHRSAPEGKLEGVFRDPLFDRLSQLRGDLKEAVRRAQAPDPLVGPLVVVILDPDGGALDRLLEAVKLRPLQELPQQRFPEPLDLAQGHRMVGPRADVLDPLFLELLLKPGLPPPVGVLPAVVGQHLLGDPVVGHRPPVGLEHVLGGLAAVQPQRGDVAAVVVDETDQVGVVTPEPYGQDIALPELVRPGPFKKPRLGRVLLGLDRGLLHQPLRGQGLVNRRRAGAHEEKALEYIADPSRTVLGVRRFHGYRLLTDLLGDPALPGERTLGFKPCGSVKPKDLHPTMDRMGADPKLLGQQLGAVPLLQVKLGDPQSELQGKRQGAALPLAPPCRPLGGVCHRMTSSLCKWFFTLGSVTQFSQIRVIINWRLRQPRDSENS